jgi:hypothetical protein
MSEVIADFQVPIADFQRLIAVWLARQLAIGNRQSEMS